MVELFPGNLAPNPPAPRKKMILAGLGVAAILLLPFLGVTVLWHDRCPTTEVQTVASPDHRFVLTQVTKDCGKRMPIATEVRLIELDEGKARSEKTVLILPSAEKLPITWNTDNNAAINLPNNQSQVVTYKPEWRGIHIALIGDIISSVPKDMLDQ